MSFRRGANRLPVAPLAALFALAVLAMAWLASAHVCARPIVVGMTGMAMPGMSMGGAPMAGMDMASGAMPMLQTPVGSFMICPVVAGLIVLSTVLAAWAIVATARDPHRGVTLAVLLRTLATLPVVRTFASLAAAGGLAIATIVAVDGQASLSVALAVTLTVILGGIAIAATLCSLVLARLIVALCTRLLVAVAGAIAERRAAQCAFTLPAPRRPLASAAPIALGRGLRAPPLPAR